MKGDLNSTVLPVSFLKLIPDMMNERSVIKIRAFETSFKGKVKVIYASGTL
jgi:hypothetical protein